MGRLSRVMQSSRTKASGSGGLAAAQSGETSQGTRKKQTARRNRNRRNIGGHYIVDARLRLSMRACALPESTQPGVQFGFGRPLFGLMQVS